MACCGLKLTFSFTANYVATDNCNRYTKTSVESTVNIIYIMITTCTIVTNNTTKSNITKTHESNLILFTNINRNLKGI